VPKIYKLKTEIASCKQGNLQVIELLSKLMGLWNELENNIRVPISKCGVAEKMTKMMEDDKIHQFLLRLDDDVYSTI